MYDRLIEILESQLSLYSELLESARQKKAFVIKNNIEGIRGITSRENAVIGKLQKTEREREALAAGLAKAMGVPADGLTLAILIGNIKEYTVKERLNSLRINLRADMDELKAINEQIKSLINHNLEYIDFTMNLLRSSVSGPVYAGAEEIHGQVFFDARG